MNDAVPNPKGVTSLGVSKIACAKLRSFSKKPATGVEMSRVALDELGLCSYCRVDALNEQENDEPRSLDSQGEEGIRG
jgi:hypothetical protein